MAKIVYTAQEFVDILKYIASIPTVYNNKFPNNCGYYDGSKYSFDCWNMIKSVINGWKDTKQKGYYVKGFSPTGDIDGLTILNKCTKKSTDFKQLNQIGAYLFIRNNHAGVYVGETVIDGKYYNVIECTTSWSTRKVIYSWVDADGTRRRYKGGSVSKKWNDWGLMCWIDYSNATQSKPQEVVKPVETPKVEPQKDNKDGMTIILKSDATYYDGSAIPSFVKKSTLYYRGTNNNGVVISTQKSGAVTGVVKEDAILCYADESCYEKEVDKVIESQSIYKVATKSGANLNIRKAPTVNSGLLCSMKNGTQFIVTEIKDNKAPKDNLWGYIPAKNGWTCLNYCQKI